MPSAHSSPSTQCCDHSCCSYAPDTCDAIGTSCSGKLHFVHVPKTGGTSVASSFPPSWRRVFMPHLRKAFPSDPCHQKLGWRNVKRQHFTPDELVRCGVVSASFFANRTNICTVRDPVSRLASGATWNKMNVSSFLAACETADPRVNHDLWVHCRPQSDFTRFCHRLVRMESIDAVLFPELEARGISKRAPAAHIFAARSSGGVSATTLATLGMTAGEMAAAMRRYACDFKLAALGWPSLRDMSTPPTGCEPRDDSRLFRPLR